jgi:NADPH-dependent glutamate synthase beta subunit-like oxidoreductase
MTLPPFTHATAASLDEAAALKARHPGVAVVVAGGTDLLGTLKDRVHPATPDLLIDLKRIPGLRSIEEHDGALRIGALVTLADLAADNAVREHYPLLAEAARSVASPQIRNMGTVGGNICQEPRCWYYRAPGNHFHCLRKGGTSCPAIFGDNRYHSIFGAARVLDTPCEANCPNHTAIPLLMAAVREGDLQRAAKVLLAVNPMPAITGRVCPHTCEEGCNRSQFDAAVSIREVERFVGDYVLDHADELYEPPAVETKWRVAVVGAGPAGLTAAYFLRRQGHQVTVFDELPEPGGMLATSIPEYRLPKEVVGRQVRALERMGIGLASNAGVGHGGRTLEGLRRGHDAVFLATGVWLPKALGLDHEELLTSGLAFLRDTKRHGTAPVGRDVLVIGGGSVAIDVAITARRLGARTVTMACLEPREEMPAIREDVEQALAEGIEILTSWGPERVLEDKGTLRGLQLVRCTSVFDAQGRFRPDFDTSATRSVVADQVFLAIGQTAALSYTGESLATAGGLVAVEEDTFATNLPGVFAGGDVTSGPATVVQAIAAGRHAAGAMHHYLVRDAADEPAAESAAGSLVRFDVAVVTQSIRVEAPVVPAQRRTIADEDRETLAATVARDEAKRCANCGCVAVNSSDIAVALLALGAEVKTTKRTIPTGEFFAAYPMRTTVLEGDELVTGIDIPRPHSQSRQRYLKFRLRNAIDFPIVSVACVLTLDGETVEKASIAIGAVAPIPTRATEVESFLEGRRLDEATVAEACSIGVNAALALGGNGFKVHIVRALLRHALLDGPAEGAGQASRVKNEPKLADPGVGAPGGGTSRPTR